MCVTAELHSKGVMSDILGQSDLKSEKLRPCKCEQPCHYYGNMHFVFCARSLYNSLIIQLHNKICSSANFLDFYITCYKLMLEYLTFLLN